jgi:hypothetical protein
MLHKKMAVFWVVAQCSLLEISQRPSGGSKDLLNVGKIIPDYTALEPRRLRTHRRENLKAYLGYIRFEVLTAVKI